MDIENLAIIEDLYNTYLKDPSKLSLAWREYFANFNPGSISDRRPRIFKEQVCDQGVIDIINAYRNFGHLAARTNPLQEPSPTKPWQLEIEQYGFSQNDLEKEFKTFGIMQQDKAKLKELIEALEDIYCQTVGVEYLDLNNHELALWIQSKIEPSRFSFTLTPEQKRTILEQLNRSELFESFIHTKYPGQKRFSLEGGESLIPILEAFIEKGAELGAEEFILGMAHRGRLNVLSNILKKSYVKIFSEFDEKYVPDFEGSGDVKYHKGFYSETLKVEGHKVQITLTPNPSHLESVNPVVEGQVKAKQIQKKSENAKDFVIPILIHGDAAISGQGVVYETLQLAKLSGYDTGGTIHVIVNNQIGFTTLPEDARSTQNCTDIAKAFGAPVFHVNGEDPESCFGVALLAMEIRHKFHCDVFIDLCCYRKYGHNETDEPGFTQPREYAIIKNKRPVRELYKDYLIEQGSIEKKIAEELQVNFKNELEEALKSLPKAKTPPALVKELEREENKEPNITLEQLKLITNALSTIPKDFSLHSKLKHLLQERQMMLQEKPVDWGMAENLAYGSLLLQGKNIRLTGQDVGRGTFSHRHGLWVDQQNKQKYFPLQHISKNQGRFDLINSPLSEYASLGFEFGYSMVPTNTLVIWEAQFGDFANGAQIIIDQYIATAEQKWGVKSSLTLLLPHGYEGQGPEHSSARIERFLSLAGHDNMTLCNPTTPAQLFHLIRRQSFTSKKRPLVVFSPKALLRHPDCISKIDEFVGGTFVEILDDARNLKEVDLLIFCSGKIYYDLQKEIGENVAIIRVEQIYPLNIQMIEQILKKYSTAKKVVWVQEEPKNMGAWHYISPKIQEALKDNHKLLYVGRDISASPAVGSYALHKKEWATLLKNIQDLT